MNPARGMFSPFMFISAFIMVFLMISAMMAATGWTGISHRGNFTYECAGDGTCGAMVAGNMLALMTFQSSFMFFNLILGIFYVILGVAFVGLLVGAG
jgi:hypothetical protein